MGPVLPGHLLPHLPIRPSLTSVLREYMQLALKVAWPRTACTLENCVLLCPFLQSVSLKVQYLPCQYWHSVFVNWRQELCVE